ncbi:cysteine--tRNA ligase [bacterium]|nr:MAG: cysteine--tRNA ligase [bacterium]
MKLYNTLSKTKEKFKPLKDNIVRMYTCGPTVYDYAHIGNFRSYLCADFLRRTLEYLGYKVIQVKNITDVGHLTQDNIGEGEDKIELKAKKERIETVEGIKEKITLKYERAFKADEQKLNIEPARFYPRATENIAEMIEAVKELIKKGYAYEKDGAVFFDIKKFANYGKLSGNTLKKLIKGSRIKCETRKKNPFDFYLWRPAEKKHLMQWQSPWGKGYPGWHIECSVMSRKYLKTDTLDIHSGGEDNIFPHHENEIAQSEALTGKKFVNYWFHSRYLLVEGEKMAKSKGNFYTLKDLEKNKYDPLVFRLLVFSTHYHSPLDFSFKALDQARTNLNEIQQIFISRILNHKGKTSDKINGLILNVKNKFLSAIEDDLNTPQALAAILSFIKKVNISMDNKEIDVSQTKKIYDLMMDFNKVLGLNLDLYGRIIPQNIRELARKRYELREENKFNEADKIRKEIEDKGYEVSDTEKDYIIRKRQ